MLSTTERSVHFQVGSGIKTEDILSVTYTWCEVNYMLCIWPIMLWGAEVSHRGAPGDQIQNFWSVSSRGQWLLGKVAPKGHRHRHGGDLRTPCRKSLPTRDLNPAPSGCQEIMLTTIPLCCPNITHKDRFWCSIKRIRLLSLGTRLIDLISYCLLSAFHRDPGCFSVLHLSVTCV